MLATRCWICSWREGRFHVLLHFLCNHSEATYSAATAGSDTRIHGRGMAGLGLAAALRVGTWGFCLSSVLQRSSFSLLGPLVPVCSLCPKRWAMGLVSQHLLRRGMRGGFVGIRRRCLGFKRAAFLFQQSNYCGILTEHLTCFGLRGSFEIYSLSFRDASVDQ